MYGRIVLKKTYQENLKSNYVIIIWMDFLAGEDEISEKVMHISSIVRKIICGGSIWTDYLETILNHFKLLWLGKLKRVLLATLFR